MSIQHQDDETRQWHKANWRMLCWLLVLTGLIRCVVLVALHGQLEADPDAYRKLAGNVAETGVYGWKTLPDSPGEAGADRGESIRPTAFRPPLYPLVLLGIGGVHSIWPIAILHWLLGVATVGMVACLGWRSGLGTWSVAAALFVAVDPILLQQSTLVMTETLAAFLATWALFCLSGAATSCVAQKAARPSQSTGWPSTVTGLVLGLCVLCRPTFLPWLALIALARVLPWQTVVKRPGEGPTKAGEINSFPRRLVGVAVLVGVAGVVISPWVIRNQLVFGKPKLTTTHGGYTVLLGNNPLFYEFLTTSGTAGTWDGEQLSRASHRRALTAGAEDDQWGNLRQLARRAEHQATVDGSEFADDELAYALARRYIREQPGMFAYASGLRMTRLWRLAPHRVTENESTTRKTARYLVGGWYALVFGMAVVGLGGLGRRILTAPWLYGLQLCFVFTAVHMLYWSDMRMRAPLMPLVCLAAASGLATISGRLRQRNA